MLADTTYTIYALPLDASGQVFPYVTKLCTTLSGGGPGLSQLTIALSEITATSVRMVVTPNDQTASFHDGLIRKTYCDSIGMDSAFVIINSSPYIQYTIDNWVWLNLESNTEFYALAQGVNSNGELGDRAIESFTTLGGVGVCANTKDIMVLYPNPCNGNNVNLQSTAVQKGIVSIYSLNGQLLREIVMQSDKQAIDVTSLENGAYILKFSSVDGKNVQQTKLVIQK